MSRMIVGVGPSAEQTQGQGLRGRRACSASDGSLQVQGKEGGSMGKRGGDD